METLEVTLNNPEMFRYVWVLSSSFAPGNKEVRSSSASSWEAWRQNLYDLAQRLFK